MTRRKPHPSANGKSNGAAIATIDPPSALTITRAEANRMLKARAQERYHEARAHREEGIRNFESEFGRSDRIDAVLIKDLQNLQLRFAAIGARHQRHGYGSEPKVSKFTRQLGEIIGELSAHVATERALELFAPVEERDYLGVGGTLGRKGFDESLLVGFHILDETVPKNVTPTVDDDGDVCLHEEVEPYEEDPRLVVCTACGEEFATDQIGTLPAEQRLGNRVDGGASGESNDADEAR
jgi:hypothetical protein